MTPDCEILLTENTLRRGIAGFRAKIVKRNDREVVVQVWDDFKSVWSEPQIVRPEEVKTL
jgi:hypothetical protein